MRPADVIIMVTDVKRGPHSCGSVPLPRCCKRARKPVAPGCQQDATAVGGVNPDIYEFYSLGLGDPIEVSAVHGHGTGDLLDWCVDHFPEETSPRGG